ncbi:mannose receptor C type 1-like protein, partial [Aphelenchoides avenae]
FIRTRHAAEKDFYIGLTRNFTGHWIWLDHSVLNYTAWKSAEPSDNNTSDHCVQVATKFGPTSGRWEVVSCDNQRSAVCQRDLSDFGENAEPGEPFTTAHTTTAFSCHAEVHGTWYSYMCGSGTISSPNYPGNYGNNVD